MSDETKHAVFNPTRRQALTMMALAGASGLIMPGLLGRDQALAATPPAKPTGQMIVGFSQEPTVFNPHMLHIEVDEGIHFSLFDPLFAIDPKASSLRRWPSRFPALKMAASLPMVFPGRSSCATTSSGMTGRLSLPKTSSSHWN